ncbi:tenascin-N-like isoform X2 [Polyodon spathula]|uniref:tenascin-N-like isoform X2 n=1 Tax=Polyodon spathula TaxID=7913 RepID=UPI001B7ECFC4|nr:tenascin-N-like isoform X2 [Polyodon spathula]
MTLSFRPLLLLGALCVCSVLITADKPAPDQTGDHEVTFRHIYKIEMPTSSDCKVELDSLPAKDEGTKLVATPVSLNADNNMVFKHNIRLQTPKCDCGASEAFKSMLSRLNRLEEEVTYLKDQCSQDCCGGGAGLASLCSGHGTFKRDTCGCDCHEGWEGEDCSIRSCLNECSDNGRCVDGKCVCYEGYTGVDCSEQLCLNDCSDKGRCVDGMCQCFSGFTGEDCSQRTCLNDCSSNGECDDGVCICEEGFFGDDCSRVLGPKEFRLVKASEESLLVSWDYVPGAEYYLLTYYPEGAEGNIKQIKVPKTKNSHLITGLTSGVNYIINLYTFIKDISSEPSNLEASTVVSSIDSINVVSQMEDSIHVEWKNPPTEVDFFKLTIVNPKGQENEVRVQMAKGAKTSYIIRDLQPGTLYLIKVQSVKRDIEGKPSSVNGVTDIDSPSNLVTKNVTEDTATLTWTRVQAPIDGYRINYTSADGQSQEISVGADKNSHKLTGLKPGVEYAVYIWAMKGNRSSKKTSTKAVTEIDAPSNLVTKNVTEDTAILSWTRVQAPIDGYRINYTSADGQSQEISVGVDKNSHKLTGLRPGVEYTVYIWAMKGNRSSKKTATKAVTEIDAPSNLVTKNVTEDTAILTWARVQAPIDGYRINYTSADGQSQEISVGVDKNSHKLTGLRPGVEYTVYIWAMKGNRSSKKTPTKTVTEIDAPSNLVTKNVTEDTAILSWTRVQAPIDGYRISYTSADGQSQEISVGADKNSHKLTGLRPGVEYTVYIWAMKGNRSSKKTPTKAVTEIDAPSNLVTKNVTEDTAILTWARVQAPIDGYRINYTSADGQSQEISVGVDKNSHKLTGLRPGVEYTVYIWAIKGNRSSKKTSTKTVTEIDAPSNLVTKNVTEDTAILTWTRVQAPIDGYRISYTSADGQSQEISVGADRNSHKLTGLRPGVEYAVYIWAMKGNRSSKKTSTEDVTEIDAPSNLVTKSVTEDTATLTWTRVRAPVDGYRISYTSADGQSQEIPVGADKNSHKLTGLRPGVEYTVYIWARKGNRSSKKTSTKAITDIDAPSNLVTKNVTEDTAILTWTRVQAPIDGYRISYTSADGQSQEISVGADRNSHKLTGLRPGVEYAVYIWAMKGNRSSKKTSTEDVTEIDAPSNLVTKSVTEDTATLTWTRVQAPVDGYRISYTSADGQIQEISVGADKDSHKLTGLRPGVEYTVYIWAIKGNLNSKKTFTKAVTEIDAPTNLVTKSVTEDNATLTWTRAQAPIDGYMIRYTSADGQSQEISVGADKNSHKLTGLKPGVEYTVYIWAMKGNRSSKKTSTKAVTEIDAPTNLVTKSVTEDTATLTWNRVQAPINGYRISYTSADGQSQEISVGADKNSHKLTGLRPGVEYTVYIWAMKGNLNSKKTSTKAVTEIDAPTNLVTKSVTEDTATLTWNRVQAPIDGYRISYTSADGQSQEISVGADKNSHKLTGLRPGVEYTVYIWAIKGNLSSKKTSTKAVTEIDAPTNLVTKSVTEDTATLTWNRVQAPIDGYRISYTSADGQSQEISVGADKNSHKLTGLRPGVEYTVYIWAIKGNLSSKKTSTKAVTEIDAPTNLVAKSVTEDTATLTWNRVQAPIDGYRISYTSADGQSQEISVGAEKNSHKLTGLRPGVEYTVYIWAMKGNLNSKKTSTKAVTEIDAPTNLVARSVTEDTATLTWTRVQAPIDGYRIRYTSADGQIQEISVGADKNSHKLTGLRPGVEYTVYIWAIKGNLSSKKTATKAVTEIDAPTNLKVTDAKQASGVVTWTPPQAVISGYILTYKRADGKGQEKERTLSSADRSYLLGGLEQGVHYIVRLVAFRGAMRSRTVETTFTTVGVLFPLPMDCTQVMKNGNTSNGIYTIYLNSDRSQPMKVYCDMTTDGGGWIVIQRRNSGKIDFFKRWKNYTQGFGDMNEEFWLGLDKMYDLTNSQQYELRVDLRAGSESVYAVYDNFKLAPARQKYKLTIGNYRGTAGDAMTYHQGRAFTTVDRDNDIALSNCAFTHRGAWWYKNCHLANLNGQYGQTTHSVGVNWEPWKGHEFSIPFVEMKMRPRIYSENPVLGRKKRSLAGRGKRRTE